MRRSILALSLAGCCAWPIVALAAPQNGVERQSMDMFNAMLNVTEPGAHMGQRRGVLSGGSIVERSRLMNESLFQVVPPSFEAGCGGIDLFGGSFSYISAEQFESLMRSIAANATGYAFELALSAMCPTCVETMEGLQKKIQQLNQGFLNSCQLARGIVNDTADAMDVSHKDKTSLIGMARGWGDVFETRSLTTGSSPVEQAASNLSNEEMAAEDLQGNLVWKALKRRNAGSWFSGGDDTLLEAIMSITGSVIIGPPQEAPDGQGRNFSVSALRGNLLTVRDLMQGSRMSGDAEGAETYQRNKRVLMYVCDSHSQDGCLQPRVQEMVLRGLDGEVRSMFLGDESRGRVGLIAKFRFGVDDLTEEEESFMELIPGTIGTGLRTLASTDIGIARVFAERAAPVVALDMVDVIMTDLLGAAEHAVALERNAYGKRAIEQIRFAKEELAREQKSAADRYGNAQTLLTYYRDLVEQAKSQTILVKTESAN